MEQRLAKSQKNIQERVKFSLENQLGITTDTVKCLYSKYQDCGRIIVANITTSLFQEMVQAGATRLNKQAEYVNSLNVFPVPDGDTGTNMGMTIENGAKEVSDRSASTVGEAAGIFAKGLLMGARGNSGVITSQLFRGFSQSVKDKEELDGAALAAAFQSGVEVAYKAVMKPVEGTILTVSRGAAIGAKKKSRVYQ